jgi:hypothetical protein
MFERCHTDAPPMPLVGYDAGQAHPPTAQRPRYLMLAVLVGTLVASLLAVATAGAANITVSNCLQLQHELNDAEQGDVITLAALCTKGNSGKAEGSFNLPSAADLTIQGQSGTTAGFEGAGVAKHAREGRGNGLVLRNLVVENYSLNEKSAVTLYPNEGALPVIESDRFVDDTDSTSNNSARGGALYISTSNSTCAYTAPLSIVDSLFQGDRIVDTSTAEHNRDLGGAAYAEIRCNSASTPIEFATLDGNTFAEDAIGTQAGGAFGGALYLTSSSGAEVHVSVEQTDDVFENDAIASTAPTGAYGGGGEWAPSLGLTSTGDRYTGDSLPAPREASASSQGAGLGVTSSTCSEKVTPSAVLNDAVLAANRIGPASEGGESAGALYATCKSNEPHGHFHLTLNDSTLAGNQAPGGVSGIDGEDTDQLVLNNSIVASPPGQADIGGFRPKSDGSLTSSFSDACTPGTSTIVPLPGEGNICADPLLPGAEAGDVQETQSSPTIDAGSNALVPAGLATDAFDDTRILAGRAGCAQSFPAVVDIGADELAPPVPSCPAPAQKQPPAPTPALASARPGQASLLGLETSSTGAALRLSCTSIEAQSCSGTIYIVAEETLHGKQVIAVGAARHRVSVTIGQAPFSLPAGGAATFTVKLNAAGRALLRRFHAISASISANEAASTSTPLVLLRHEARFSEPEQHGRRSSKRPKHR